MGAVKANLKPFYSQKLAWQSCDDGMQCATLKVPRSYTTKNTHGVFDLPVIKQPATGTAADYRGVLMLNPGGPGGSGVSLIKHNLIDDASLHKAYDFVSFDPRGVGKSSPAIDCQFNDSQLNAVNSAEDTPQGSAQIKGLLGAYGALGHACGENDPNVIKWVDTASVARDLDILRAALGQKQVNWFGFSYGTKIGEVYASLFPKNVGRMALDGVVPMSLTYYQEGIAHAKTDGLAIQHYFATCATRDDCPFKDDPAGGEAKVVALINQLRAHPVSVTTQRGSGTVDDTYIRSIFNEYTENQADYGSLDTLLAAAFDQHDLGPIWNDVQYAEGRNPDGTFPDHGQGLGTFSAIKCIDSPTTQTIAQYQKAAAQALKVDPILGADDVWSTASCLHWPARTSMPPQKFINAGQPPILLIGSTHDYRTPLSWAKTTAHQIKNSSLIEADNYGHTSYSVGNKCITDSVNNYLINGVTPGKTVSCYGNAVTPTPVK